MNEKTTFGPSRTAAQAAQRGDNGQCPVKLT